MDQRRDGPVLTPVGGSSKLPIRLAALAVVLILVALLKPWGAASGPDAVTPSVSPLQSPASAQSAAAGGDASPSPIRAAPTPSPNPDAIECLEPDGWRIVTLQRSGERESRSWTLVRPVVASGPDDPAIEPVRVGGQDLIEIGFCGVGQRAGLVPVEIQAVWMLAANGTWQPHPVSPIAFPGSGGGGFALMTGEVAATGGSGAGGSATPGPTEGPRSSGASAPATQVAGAVPVARSTWPPGRYVFAVTTGGAVPKRDWFGAEIIAPPPEPPAASPPFSPRPSR